MLARAHTAGVLWGWVTADEAYGQNLTFRAWLADREIHNEIRRLLGIFPHRRGIKVRIARGV